MPGWAENKFLCIGYRPPIEPRRTDTSTAGVSVEASNKAWLEGQGYEVRPPPHIPHPSPDIKRGKKVCVAGSGMAATGARFLPISWRVSGELHLSA
ncbi:hypothetical protein BaRGS_00001737 [Batillaria attramentaria]|uniref:Uncharacterized protein n=1 Tax=Batillaria attramentaria TaxID=370345 RepID=A0ABD0M618_9CAEN